MRKGIRVRTQQTASATACLGSGSPGVAYIRQGGNCTGGDNHTAMAYRKCDCSEDRRNRRSFSERVAVGDTDQHYNLSLNCRRSRGSGRRDSLDLRNTTASNDVIVPGNTHPKPCCRKRQNAATTIEIFKLLSDRSAANALLRVSTFPSGHPSRSMASASLVLHRDSLVSMDFSPLFVSRQQQTEQAKELLLISSLILHSKPGRIDRQYMVRHVRHVSVNGFR